MVTSCLLALVLNDNQLCVVDAEGVVCSYTSRRRRGRRDCASGPNEEKEEEEGPRIPHLCFSSHGQAVDDFLTPCFDEEGRHGSPEEGCFCGLVEPHIHAHMYDSTTCHDRSGSIRSSGSSSSGSPSDNSWRRLAEVTLLPEETIPQEDIFISHPLHFQVDCNSRNLRQEGTRMEENHPTRRLLFSVKHDDHVDALVHDATTGNIWVEYNHCTHCTGKDYHGVLGIQEERRWHSAGARGGGGGHTITLRLYRAATWRAETLSEKDLIDPIIEREEVVKVERRMANKRSMQEKLPSPRSEGDCCNGSSSKTSSCGAANNNNNSKPCGDVDTPATSCCGATSRTNVSSNSCCSSSAGDARNHCCKGTSGPPASSSCSGDDTLSRLEKHAGQKSAQKQGCCDENRLEAGSSCCNGVGGEESPGRQGPPLHSPPENCAGASDASFNKMTRRSTFYVQEICCATEVAAIRSIISRLDGIDNMRVNVTSKLLYVDHDVRQIDASVICHELNRERFGARIEQDGALEIDAMSGFVTSELSFDDPIRTHDREAIRDLFASFGSVVKSSVIDDHGKRVTIVHNALLLPAVDAASKVSRALGLAAKVRVDGNNSLVWNFSSVMESGHEEDEKPVHTVPTFPRANVIFSGIFCAVAMLSYIGGKWDNLKYVAVVSVAFGLPPIALKAAASLRSFRFDVNCLMTAAVIGALALQDFTEAATVTFLFALSEWLEVRATSRARNALSAIIQLRPEKANLIHPESKEIVVVPAKVVPVGALVSVKAGDQIPCDGIVIEGCSTVDESSLTGESRPVQKGPNDLVSGGTINSGNTHMIVRTVASADNSAVARLIRLVEEAQANRSETEKLVDEFAKYYTPTLLLLAFAMCTIPWAWGQEVGREWVQLGLVLIVVACPCALIVSTPVTYVAGLAAMAQRGILVKGGAHLEALGMVKTVCFDKTGTLTNGKFQLLHLDVIGSGFSRVEVMEYIWLMEDRASHPLAQALIQGARNESINMPTDKFVRNHTFLAGEGVVGVVGNSQVFVGNARLFQRLGLYMKLSLAERQRVEKWGKIGTVGFMSIGDKGIVCAYCVADAVRSESADVIQKLHNMSIDVLMLTGDHRRIASAIGLSVGLDERHIRSHLLPEEKLSIVSEIHNDLSGGKSFLSMLCSRRHLVLMCGDGVNDAPALAAADVGVAIAGSALAMETADVTLLDPNLSKLVDALDMGRRVIRKIKENVVFSLFVKFLVLGLALAGRAALWAAIASDVGAMLLVTVNSMLLLPASQPPRAEPSQTSKTEKFGQFEARQTSAGTKGGAA